MGWNVDGTFTRENPDFSGSDVWQKDQQASIKIIDFRHDYHDQGLASGIQNTINIDGYNEMRAALNLGSNKIINLSSATVLTDAARYGQCIGSMDYGAQQPNELRLIDRDGSVVDTVEVLGGGGGSTDLDTIYTASTVSITDLNTPGSTAVINTVSATEAGVVTPTQLDKINALPTFLSGSFTPNFINVTGTVSGTLYWTRVNDQITVQGRINWTGLDNADSSAVVFNGLPYDVTATVSIFGVGMVGRIEGIDFGGPDPQDVSLLALEGINNTDEVGLYINFSLGSTTSPGQSNPCAYSQLSTSGYMDIFFSYRTDEPV